MSENKQGWHVKKEVSYGHILMTISIILSGFVWALSVETRLTTVEVGQDFAHKILERIENKLDRMEARFHDMATKQ